VNSNEIGEHVSIVGFTPIMKKKTFFEIQDRSEARKSVDIQCENIQKLGVKNPN